MRCALAGLLLACAACAPAHATTDEGALGKYFYTDASFSISFDWQLDGLHGLRVKGYQYPKVIDYEASNLNGNFYNYDVVLPRRPHSNTARVLHFSAMVDGGDGGPLHVYGTYIELVSDGQGHDRVVYRRVFILHHVRGTHEN